MEIYSLTARGKVLAHNTRSPHTPEWGVIYFLAKQGRATTEQIKNYVPSSTSITIARLRMKGIIREETGSV